MKCGEVAWWKEVKRSDVLNSLISIYLFFGYITSMRFYEEIWTVTQKVLSVNSHWLKEN